MNEKEIKKMITYDFPYFKNFNSINLFNFSDIKSVVPPKAKLENINEFGEVWVYAGKTYFIYENMNVIKIIFGSNFYLGLKDNNNIAKEVIYGFFRGGVTDVYRNQLLNKSLLGIHCSLVKKADKGILIIGPKGTGKTTCALTAIQNGWEILTDEFVGINVDGNIQSLYRLPSLYEEDLKQYFPNLSNRAWKTTKSVINDDRKVILNIIQKGDYKLNIEQVDILYLLPSHFNDEQILKKKLQKTVLLSQIIEGFDFDTDLFNRVVDTLNKKIHITNVRNIIDFIKKDNKNE